MGVAGAAVRAGSMGIRALKADEGGGVTADDGSDSRLGSKAEVMEFN